MYRFRNGGWRRDSDWHRLRGRYRLILHCARRLRGSRNSRNSRGFGSRRRCRSGFRQLDGGLRGYRLGSLSFRRLWLFGDRLLRLLAKPAEQAFFLASLGRRFFVVVGTKHGRRLSQGSDGPAVAHREFSKRRTDYFESGWFMRNVLSKWAWGPERRQAWSPGNRISILAPPGPPTLNPAGRRTG